MADFTLKKGDTSPALKATLTESDGTPLNLTGASVAFHMRPAAADSLVVDAAATIVNASEGRVKYAWASGDTDTPNRYEAEFVVTYGDGTTETVPNTDTIAIQINDTLA